MSKEEHDLSMKLPITLSDVEARIRAARAGFKLPDLSTDVPSTIVVCDVDVEVHNDTITSRNNGPFLSLLQDGVCYFVPASETLAINPPVTTVLAQFHGAFEKVFKDGYPGPGDIAEKRGTPTSHAVIMHAGVTAIVTPDGLVNNTHLFFHVHRDPCAEFRRQLQHSVNNVVVLGTGRVTIDAACALPLTIVAFGNATVQINGTCDDPRHDVRCHHFFVDASDHAHVTGVICVAQGVLSLGVKDKAHVSLQTIESMSSIGVEAVVSDYGSLELQVYKDSSLQVQLAATASVRIHDDDDTILARNSTVSMAS